MQLGAFSISLAVKDLGRSRTFYEKLGFSQAGGDPEQNWLIMRNGEHVIGLFQGMFDKNIMTFIPGWDQHGEEIESFKDVRDIQRELKTLGVGLLMEADETSTGPANLMMEDPDGNQILIDQHR